MKENSYKRKEGFWYGLVRIPMLILVLGIASLIFYSSLRYVRPGFSGGYLSGNELTYIGVFRLSLIIHLFVAPFLIFTSSLLLFFKLEIKQPYLHRLIGRITIYLGTLLLIPSALVLSYYAIGGIIGQLLFFILTILTLISILLAFHHAKNRNINYHRKWIIRFYVLLTSAIWLRINMFIGSFFLGFTGVNLYLISAFLSWVPQLLITEMLFLQKKRA